MSVCVFVRDHADAILVMDYKKDEEKKNVFQITFYCVFRSGGPLRNHEKVQWSQQTLLCAVCCVGVKM